MSVGETISKIGVIGCGNMASAIVKGIHRKYKETKFFTFTPSHTRAQSLAQDVQGTAVKSLAELANCESLIIACKPQQFKELAGNLRQELKLEKMHIISIMAAVPAEVVSKELGSKMITRVMPNTPSLFNEGVSLIHHLPEVSSEHKEMVKKFFSACSTVHLLEDEALFDQVTTVTGSGPAYVFLFAKTFSDELMRWGVEESEARKMVTQLFKGSAQLMESNSEKPLSQLIDEVTSKGGVTIEAVKHFQQKDLGTITQEALKAACKRSQELKDSF